MAPVATLATLTLLPLVSLLATTTPTTATPLPLPLPPHPRASYYGSLHNLPRPAALLAARSLPTGWTHAGCVTESTSVRLLQGFSFSSSDNTPELCTRECAKRGYALAGLEYGDECYCGNEMVGLGGGVTVGAGRCAVKCAGGGEETCGDAWFLDLYSYDESVGGLLCATSGAGSNASASASAWAQVVQSSSGPATASSTGETTTGTVDPTLFTTATTTTTTTTVDPTPFTTTNGTEPTGTSTPLSSSSATTTSTPPSATTTTTTTFWARLGCALDPSTRLFTSYYEQKVDNMTPALCQATCSGKGFPYAGLESGNECWCAATLPDGMDWQSKAAACTQACSGDGAKTCGGEWALEVWVGKPAASAQESTGGVLIVSPTDAVSASSTGASSAASTGVSSVSSTGVSSVSSTSVVPTTATSPILATATTSSTPTPTSSTPTSTLSPTTTAIPSSSATHYVWAHHMVGYTYSYASSDWTEDVTKAAAYGIDGFALNMGSNSWQPVRIADAYAAAESSGGGSFKLFLSFDMTSMSCSSAADGATLVNLVKTYAASPAQAMVDGAVLVSTFSGESCTFGTGSVNGWDTAVLNPLKAAGVAVHFVPAFFSATSSSDAYSWMDGQLNWNSAWPMGDFSISSSDYSADASGLAAVAASNNAEATYMPAISPFFFTHFGADSYNKNWLYRSDDWLYCTRWEQVIAMRGSGATMTELLTWNDFGESSYLGPIHGSLPGDSGTWVNGMDHTALATITQYYAAAFRTGAYPAITSDSVTMWSHPHPALATASNDPVARPTNYAWTTDYAWAVVLLSAPAEVTLTSGSGSETWSVPAGLSKLKIASRDGSIGATIVRGGSTVVQYTSGSAFSYTSSPVTYNYNYFVGSASAGA